MASRLAVEAYREEDAERWDRFVLGASANGTFLQSRRFLSYHPEGRFEDASLVVRKGSEVVAVVPAARVAGGGSTSFVSHPGSTFGGPVVSRGLLAAEAAIDLVELIDERVWDDGYDECVLKLTPSLFCRDECSSLEYALQHAGYAPYGELSFVIDYGRYPAPVERNFTARRRRDCRYGERAGLRFSRLSDDRDVADFHAVLVRSLEKYGTSPVHSLAEMLDFKNGRLEDECRFYGVFHEGEMVAGSMVFTFEERVFHTQYLAADPDSLELFPMNYLDWNLIRVAREEGFGAFSFGISTEDHGRVLNGTLARFKDGFGGSHAMNLTYSKRRSE